MLASNEPWELKDLRYPVVMTPKYDGIRVLRHRDYSLLTRREKPIPNGFIRTKLMEQLVNFPGFFDGEILCGKNYYETESAVMSQQHEREHFFVCMCFDYIGPTRSLGTPYKTRVGDLQELLEKQPSLYVLMAPALWINNEEQLLTLAKAHEEAGWEGSIIRSPDAPYKSGRCTTKSQFMLKYVRYETDEAYVSAVAPAMENLDTSCKKLHNLRPKPMVGSLHVCNDKWPTGFNIGSGWDHDIAKAWHDNPALILDKWIKFKYKPYGTKDAPRQPVFLGFRDPTKD